MKNETTGNQSTGHTALFDPEGRVSEGDGHPTIGWPSPQFRLKRSIEHYAAPDGSVHLIHEGLGTHFKIPNLTNSDRVVLELLGSGFMSRDQIINELARRKHDSSTVEVSLRGLNESGHLEIRREKNSLPSKSSERFDRQMIYFADICAADDSAESTQKKLTESTVVILGCGGLGSWAACGLACAGIGHLVLVDEDTVELSNLNRQLLFGDEDLGFPKVEAAARALTRHNADLDVTRKRKRVTSAREIAELMTGTDALVATADWPPYEITQWINQASLETGVPFIGAGQFPPLIRIGPMVIPGRSACLACQETATKRDFPMYEELAAHRSANPATASTLGAASGIIGSMIAMEVIHLLIVLC